MGFLNSDDQREHLLSQCLYEVATRTQSEGPLGRKRKRNRKKEREVGFAEALMLLQREYIVFLLHKPFLARPTFSKPNPATKDNLQAQRQRFVVCRDVSFYDGSNCGSRSSFAYRCKRILFMKPKSYLRKRARGRNERTRVELR